MRGREQHQTCPDLLGIKGTNSFLTTNFTTITTFAIPVTIVTFLSTTIVTISTIIVAIFFRKSIFNDLQNNFTIVLILRWENMTLLWNHIFWQRYSERKYGLLQVQIFFHKNWDHRGWKWDNCSCSNLRQLLLRYLWKCENRNIWGHGKLFWYGNGMYWCDFSFKTMLRRWWKYTWFHLELPNYRSLKLLTANYSFVSYWLFFKFMDICKAKINLYSYLVISLTEGM